MNFGDLLLASSIDPEQVIVMRHRPPERELNKVLPWLAAERPDVFNAYQQTQGEKVEKAMLKARYVASFIGHQPGKALFIGLYRIGDSHPLTYEEYWRVPAYEEMKAFGMRGFVEASRDYCLWFDLQLQDFYKHWKGKLVIGWPPPELSWWRRAERNQFPVIAVTEDSSLDAAMPDWNDLVLRWDELSVLPVRWRLVLSQWRGIYFIRDSSDGKAYVGSAYGADNLYGRWRNYGAVGHGGNVLLRQRDPHNFSFSILQRVSPDMDVEDIVQIESSWKDRLHTRAPSGLNDN